MSINKYNNIFFIGVAGVGMSAIAQYLQGIGKQVSGSDRYFVADQPNDTKNKLEAEGIHCFPQDGTGISENTDLVVVSVVVLFSIGVSVVSSSGFGASIFRGCSSIFTSSIGVAVISC